MRMEQAVSKLDSTTRVLIILFLLLFAIPILAYADSVGPPLPTLSIIDGEELTGSDGIEISSEPYTHTTNITILDESDIQDEIPWALWNGSSYFDAYRFFNLPLYNLTYATITSEFHSFADNHEVWMYVYFFSSDISRDSHILHDQVSYNITGLQQKRLSYSVPIETLENSTENRILTTLVSITGTGVIGSEISFHRFLVTAITTEPESLSPVSLDVQRTTGESIYSNPTIYTSEVKFDRQFPLPHIKLISSLFPDGISITPTQVNETLFLPPDSFTGTVYWGRQYNYSFPLVVENQNLYHLDIRINSTSARIQFVERIPGFSVTLSSWGIEYEVTTEDLDSAFYFPANREVFVTFSNHLRSTEVWYGDFGEFQIQTIRSNGDVIAQIDFNWIIIATLAISGIKLFILLDCIFVVAALLYLYRRRLLTDSRILPLSVFLISLMLPWGTEWQTYFLPDFGTSWFNWSYAPGLGGSFAWQEGSLFVLTGFHSNYYGVTLVSWQIALIAYLFLFTKYEPGDQRNIFALFLLCGPALEIATILYLGSSIPGPGPFLAVLSLILWFFIERRQESAVATGS
jgi:hypothetical protein